jgi:uncharacterized SAM-binding protein YcdF (DUF218 family)
MLEFLRSRLGLLWPKLSWKLFDWLSDPLLVTLALLVFAAVMLLVAGRRYRRRMVALGLGLLAAYWFVISPLFWLPATHLLMSLVPPDRGESADAIVVLARRAYIEGDRYNVAVDLVAQGRANQVVVMGRDKGQRVYQRLAERRLATDRLLSASCASTTKQEAYATAAALGDLGLSRIILVTDAPHMLRAWLTFRGLGFTVTPHIEPIPPGVAHQERSLLAIREYLGLVSYGVLGRFQRPPASDLPRVTQVAAADFPRDRCIQTAEQIRQSLPEG